MTDTRSHLPADLNNDGIIDDREFQLLQERELHLRRMSYIAIFGILAVVVYMLGFTDPTFISAASEILNMYFITLGGVIAAQMGVSAWATKR